MQVIFIYCAKTVPWYLFVIWDLSNPGLTCQVWELRIINSDPWLVYLNQILHVFMMTLFHNLPEIKWFAPNIIFTCFFLLQHYGKYWSTARNIRDNEALQNLMKISKWIDLVSLDLLAWQIVYMYLQLPKYFSMSSSFCDDLYFAIIFIYCKK